MGSLHENTHGPLFVHLEKSWRMFSIPNESLSSIITEALPELDAALAAREIALIERPLLATIEFARGFVLEVRDGDRQWTLDLESPQFVTEQWFRTLYQEIDSWYRTRYGDAIESFPSTVKGFVLIWGTPFTLEVPTTVTTPGTPGKTVWLSFPDSVLDTENPTNWLIAPPNLNAMSASDLEKVTADCKEISSLLRSIMASLMGVLRSDPIVQGFLNGVQLHMEVAAEHAVRSRHEGATPRAYWEIQIACECAYKALLQMKTGSYRATHDLFVLHDQAEPYGVTVKRDLLKNLPRWEEMVDLRYGQVDPTITAFYKAYRTMLRLVEAALAPMVILGLGKASFEIAKAPWLPEGESNQGAVKMLTDES